MWGWFYLVASILAAGVVLWRERALFLQQEKPEAMLMCFAAVGIGAGWPLLLVLWPLEAGVRFLLSRLP